MYEVRRYKRVVGWAIGKSDRKIMYAMNVKDNGCITMQSFVPTDFQFRGCGSMKNKNIINHGI